MEGILALTIPIMVMSIPLLAIWTKHQRRMAELAAMQPRHEPEFIARLERIEQRLVVLERIATDKSGNLAAEIDRLRDAPLN